MVLNVRPGPLCLGLRWSFGIVFTVLCVQDIWNNQQRFQAECLQQAYYQVLVQADFRKGQRRRAADLPIMNRSRPWLSC